MEELNYTEERDKLIPIAEKYADERNGISGRGKSHEEKEKWTAAWNMDFHGKMNELAEGLK